MDDLYDPADCYNDEILDDIEDTTSAEPAEKIDEPSFLSPDTNEFEDAEETEETNNEERFSRIETEGKRSPVNHGLEPAKDKKPRKDGNQCMILLNLARSCSFEQLMQILHSLIDSSVSLHNVDGIYGGCAVMEVLPTSALGKTVQQINGISIEDRKVIARRFGVRDQAIFDKKKRQDNVTKAPSSASSNDAVCGKDLPDLIENGFKVMLKNVKVAMLESQIKRILKNKVSCLEDLHMIRDEKFVVSDAKHDGWGFAFFRSSASANNFCKQCNGFIMGGRRLVAQVSRNFKRSYYKDYLANSDKGDTGKATTPSKPTTFRLVISNVACEVSAKELEEIFSSEVGSEVKVVLADGGSAVPHAGHGHVIFKTEELAKEAYDLLDRCDLGGSKIDLTVEFDQESKKEEQPETTESVSKDAKSDVENEEPDVICLDDPRDDKPKSASRSSREKESNGNEGRDEKELERRRKEREKRHKENEQNRREVERERDDRRRTRDRHSRERDRDSSRDRSPVSRKRDRSDVYYRLQDTSSVSEKLARGTELRERDRSPGVSRSNFASDKSILGVPVLETLNEMRKRTVGVLFKVQFSNISFKASIEQIVALVQDRAGTPESMVPQLNRDGSHKGVVMFNFSSGDVAKLCINRLHGHVLSNRAFVVKACYDSHRLIENNEPMRPERVSDIPGPYTRLDPMMGTLGSQPMDIGLPDHSLMGPAPVFGHELQASMPSYAVDQEQTRSVLGIGLSAQMLQPDQMTQMMSTNDGSYIRNEQQLEDQQRHQQLQQIEDLQRQQERHELQEQRQRLEDEKVQLKQQQQQLDKQQRMQKLQQLQEQKRMQMHQKRLEEQQRFQDQKQVEVHQQRLKEQKREQESLVAANKARESASALLKQTHGLTMEYLTSLNISLPLVKELLVINIDKVSTEEDVRDLFAIAGTVVKVHYKQTEGQAIVEMANEADAVQSVSMLHNQEYFEEVIKVRLLRPNDPDNRVTKSAATNVPRGLKGIGKGLGPRGSALSIPESSYIGSTNLSNPQSSQPQIAGIKSYGQGLGMNERNNNPGMLGDAPARGGVMSVNYNHKTGNVDDRASSNINTQPDKKSRWNDNKNISNSFGNSYKNDYAGSNSIVDSKDYGRGRGGHNIGQHYDRKNNQRDNKINQQGNYTSNSDTSVEKSQEYNQYFSEVKGQGISPGKTFGGFRGSNNRGRGASGKQYPGRNEINPSSLMSAGHSNDKGNDDSVSSLFASFVGSFDDPPNSKGSGGMNDSSNMSKGGMNDSSNMSKGGMHGSSNMSRGGMHDSSNMSRGGMYNSSNLSRGGMHNSSNVSRGGMLDSGNVGGRGGMNNSGNVGRGGMNNSSNVSRGGMLDSSNVSRGGMHNSSNVSRGGMFDSSNMSRGGMHNSSNVSRGGMYDSSNMSRGGMQNSSNMSRGGMHDSTKMNRGGGMHNNSSRGGFNKFSNNSDGGMNNNSRGGGFPATKKDDSVQINATENKPSVSSTNFGSTVGREVILINLPSNARQPAIRELCQAYGTVQGVQINHAHRTGRIIFETYHQATMAADILNNQVYNGTTMKAMLA